MSGEALGVKPEPDQGPDLETFNARQWIKGTGVVTRSVTVCGMPQLMGEIEDLKDELERVQAAEFDDDRPLAKSRAREVAEQLEAKRTQMTESMLTFRFRGFKKGEYESIVAAHDGADDDELQYHLFEAICVKPTGLTAEDFKVMHLGDQEQGVEGLGNYFLNTIVRTATRAIEGSGGDVPFSSASSALTASSSKS